ERRPARDAVPRRDRTTGLALRVDRDADEAPRLVADRGLVERLLVEAPAGRTGLREEVDEDDPPGLRGLGERLLEGPVEPFDASMVGPRCEARREGGDEKEEERGSHRRFGRIMSRSLRAMRTPGALVTPAHGSALIPAACGRPGDDPIFALNA